MPNLIPHEDDAPSPRVDVTFTAADLVAETTRATVFQISSDGQVPVRDAVNVFASGGLTVTDYEVPLGVPVTYRAEQFDASGVSLGFTNSADTQVNIDPGDAVISDPLDPAASVRVQAKVDFASVVSRSRQMALYQIGNDTVALMGAMGLLQHVPLTCQTQTLDDADMLWDVLGRTQVLVRTMPGPVRIPRALHVVVGAPSQVPQDVQYGGAWVIWDITGQEVSRSTLNVIVPVVTYQRYKDAFAGKSYADVKALYSTYLDAKQNPPAVA